LSSDDEAFTFDIYDVNKITDGFTKLYLDCVSFFPFPSKDYAIFSLLCYCSKKIKSQEEMADIINEVKFRVKP
jgi:hypothetical protein